MDAMTRIAAALADRYTIAEVIGRGGSATVYRARDLKHDRDVAIKVLLPDLSATLAAERFLREIATTARLNHPHILPLLDSGEAGGLLYFVTPYLPGESLRERLRRLGRLEVGEVVRILADVADALAHAHHHGVVHRDIKPENILFSGRHAVVADFGVARAMSVAAAERLTIGVALGTPSYMAPEQAMADPALDHRVDLYALGVVGYELLTGRPPFAGETAQEVLTAHVVLTPEPVERVRADLPGEVARLVNRCLAKHPGDRWDSADELVAQLDPLTTPTGGTPPTSATRRGSLVMGALAVVLVLAASALLLARQAIRVRVLAAAVAASSRPITFTGNVAETALSPDGMFLALVVQDSAEQRLVVRDRRGEGELTVHRGLKLTQLRWSGDGAEIRFVEYRPGANLSKVVPRLGGPIRSLETAPGLYSPDGRWMARFGRGSRLEFVPAGGGSPIEATIPPGKTWTMDFAWNRRSDRFAILTATNDRRASAVAVFTVPKGSSAAIPLDSTQVLGIAWAGDTLLYLARQGSLASLFGQPLSPGGQPSGMPILLASGVPGFEPGIDFGSTLTVSPGGDEVVFARVDGTANLVAAHVANGRITRLEPLTRGSASYLHGQLRPDGRAIAFLRDERPTGIAVGVLDLGSGTTAPLGELAQAGAVAWSPDGTRLAVTGAGATGGYGVHLIDVAGGGRRLLPSEAISSELTWLGNDSLLVQDVSHQAFHLFAAAGAVGGKRLDAAPGWIFAPRVDHAGRRIAYYLNRGQGARRLWIADRDGGNRRPVAEGFTIPLRWSSDDRLVYYADQVLGATAGSVWVVPAAGGEPRLHARLPPGFVVDDISPDGRIVYGRKVEPRGDAWVVERSAGR